MMNPQRVNGLLAKWNFHFLEMENSTSILAGTKYSQGLPGIERT